MLGVVPDVPLHRSAHDLHELQEWSGVLLINLHDVVSDIGAVVDGPTYADGGED